MVSVAVPTHCSATNWPQNVPMSMPGFTSTLPKRCSTTTAQWIVVDMSSVVTAKAWIAASGRRIPRRLQLILIAL